jgi:NAD(P)-dependent dehydrogenase (short-subunit alcohol dehydrogenase family)
MPTVLVTGASRGLGLEFVRQYAADGWQVHAGARDPAAADALAALAAGSAGRVRVHRLDVEDPATIAATAQALAGVPVDVLLNNAGTMGAKSGPTAQRFGGSDYADWERMFRINVLGPMRVAEAFVENVAASERRVIATLTSLVGSIAANRFGGMYAYRSTKAAANAIVRSLALDLARRGILAVALHPGWAKTAMGGPNAPVAVDEAVAGMRRVIAGLTKEASGRFWQYDGTELAW